MSNLILQAFNYARVENTKQYKTYKSGDFTKYLHAYIDRCAADRRYKLKFGAASITGDMNYSTAIVYYRGRKYYIAYNYTTKQYELEA